MFKDNLMKRKLVIFATFAVVLLIGALFVPAAQSSEIDFELSEEEKRKIEAAKEIDLENGELYLPENKSEEIGMDKEEKDEFDSVLQELNLWADEGYFEFKIEIVNETEEIIIETTEETEELTNGTKPLPGTNESLPPEEERLSGGSNWYDVSTSWTYVEHELGLNEFWTQWLADYGVIGVGTLASILILITKGLGAGIAIILAAAMLNVGLTYAANLSEGSGVIWTFRDYHWTPYIDSTSVDPQ